MDWPMGCCHGHSVRLVLKALKPRRFELKVGKAAVVVVTLSLSMALARPIESAMAITVHSTAHAIRAIAWALN